ncbi:MULTISPECIES: toprim domain-containing protein [unclassified Pseudomonas]|uniref:toprim domain-containing protein n=1 Tax=unclassified Pseudomonas TaxID=196821 RepID=UPI000C87CD5B|nr:MULTISPECIES: toprim domain-containing protein [unclassified Pseudomonas]PMU11722.1 DNA primase [Pseudomonas sp. FW305-20]PMU15390.1 DNA primase [Pseudomonas sp. FW305-122]PMU43233.1 DNA primase [Pseudomonas sp. FW305-47B]PMX63524.1 DNA primase [Pseudomonas sp. FW305-60]PMX64558.1 DNA primase [Pseudomonas sp. FW305-33]
MSKSSAPDLIRQVAFQALGAVENLLSEWLPEGTRNGSEWVARNTARGDRHAGSFGVSMDSGRWNDFADDAAHGGDLVSLLAYLRGCRQVEAAQEIDQRLSLGLFSSPSTVDPHQLEKRIRATEEARRVASQHELQRLQEKHGDAANQAAKLWQMGRPADRQHNYLQAKGVQPLQLRQLSRGRLLVPLCSGGRLVNLQIIDGDGVKRFLAGGRVQSCYSPLGKVSDGCRLYICEGWATGATLHIHTGSPVVCAMNAGNLKPVALAMRERYGQSVELVIAGDDDRQTLGNPGRTAANRAANAANALVLFPEWPSNAPAELSDFNDLHLWRSQQKKIQP